MRRVRSIIKSCLSYFDLFEFGVSEIYLISA